VISDKRLQGTLGTEHMMKSRLNLSRSLPLCSCAVATPYTTLHALRATAIAVMRGRKIVRERMHTCERSLSGNGRCRWRQTKNITTLGVIDIRTQLSSCRRAGLSKASHCGSTELGRSPRSLTSSAPILPLTLSVASETFIARVLFTAVIYALLIFPCVAANFCMTASYWG